MYRRTAADRRAEAARYRERTEQAQTIPTVPLESCQYDRQSRRMSLTSDHIGMPREFFVHSPRTGRDVRFVVVGPEDVLFDQDGWDGEQQIYRPVGVVPTVDHMVIYHN